MKTCSRTYSSACARRANLSHDREAAVSLHATRGREVAPVTPQGLPPRWPPTAPIAELSPDSPADSTH